MNDPVSWTVAGSDSGGGAGIQVDLKVMNALGVHGCCIVTALTAQNTQTVRRVEPVSKKMFDAQWDALQEDLVPASIKTGMLGSVDVCKQLAEKLDGSIPVVCDPVWRSSSGQALLDAEAFDHLLYGVFPNVKILTPNLARGGMVIRRSHSFRRRSRRKNNSIRCSLCLNKRRASSRFNLFRLLDGRNPGDSFFLSTN